MGGPLPSELQFEGPAESRSRVPPPGLQRWTGRAQLGSGCSVPGSSQGPTRLPDMGRGLEHGYSPAPSSASVVSPRARTPSPPRAAPVSSFSLLRGSWERSTGSLVSCTQKSGRGRCRGAPAGWSFLAVPRASVHHCHSLPKAGLLLWCAAARLTQSYTWSQPS